MNTPAVLRLPLALLLAAALSGASATSAAAAAAAPTEGDPPRRLRRADSFLGIHFDFHAGKDCTEIGKNTTPAMIENIIDRVHPDYLQIDCKGHPGITSYPTKVGNPAPGFVGDPLRVWRDVTARRGVSLYVHYSGIFDQNAVLKPGWAAIKADGKPDSSATSVFGPYADQLLIPQLREIAGVYGVDGAWVDGECWSAVPDYGRTALDAFRTATGFADAPRRAGEPHWFEFLEFHRGQFRNYLRHYITEVKRTNPGFEICSNWAYTDHMAGPVDAPVDFLSGDYSPEDSVNSARASGRYLVRQGKPWDLMAWSFSIAPKRQQKTAVQLKREAAVVLALGGGFQAYHSQKRDGSIFDEQMPAMAEVAAFCRERQALSHRAMPVPQVALLLSTAGHYRRINGLFNRDLNHVHGVLQALLEGQQAVELVGEHQLSGRLADYPLVVVPEWAHLEPDFRRDLAAYVQSGGNLLLVGPRAAALFPGELDVTLPGAPRPAGPVHLSHGGIQTTLQGELHSPSLGTRAAPFGRLHASTDPASASGPAASITRFGRGRIASTYFGFGHSYRANPSASARAFLNDLVRELFPEPMVRVTGSADVDVVVARQREKLLVHLVNTGGPHRTQPILETLTPVGPLTVAIRHEGKPTAATLEPSGKPLAFEQRDGRIILEVPLVEIHEIVVITP